jgi:hypothetical protein
MGGTHYKNESPILQITNNEIFGQTWGSELFYGSFYKKC